MNQFNKKRDRLEKWRSVCFQLGLIIAGGFTLLAFEWTSPVYISSLPGTKIIDNEEPYLPLPDVARKIEKPMVKIKLPKINSNEFEIVKVITKPTPSSDPTPEPDPNPKFDPSKWNVAPEIDPEPAPVPIAEIMPEFEGGIKKLFQYLSDNTKYPKMAKDAGIQGTVYIQFTVGKTGEIKDVKILKSVNDLLDKEAIRVVKSMPNWKPGKQSGRTVSVLYNLPITFVLKG